MPDVIRQPRQASDQHKPVWKGVELAGRREEPIGRIRRGEEEPVWVGETTRVVWPRRRRPSLHVGPTAEGLKLPVAEAHKPPCLRENKGYPQ